MLVDAAGDELESFGLRDGLGAAMRLEVADDDVAALALHFLGFAHHLIGFADAGRVAEKDLRAASIGSGRHQTGTPA